MPLIAKLHFAKYKNICICKSPYDFQDFFLLVRRAIKHFTQKQILKQHSLFHLFVTKGKQLPAEIICCFSVQAFIKVNYSTPKSSLCLLFDYLSFLLCNHRILHSPHFLSQSHGLAHRHTFQTLPDDYVVTWVFFPSPVCSGAC